MTGSSLVIRFGAGRLVVAHDDETASGLPEIAYREPGPAPDASPAGLADLLTEALRAAVPPMPRSLTIVHPHGWSERDRVALSRASAAAGVTGPSFLTEPVAVAHAVATGLRRRRAAAMVTLDGPVAQVAILVRTRAGFKIVGEPSTGGRREVVGELVTSAATAGLVPDQLAGVYLVGDEPGAPLGAEIQRTLGVPVSPRRDVETAAVHGALYAYPQKDRTRRNTRRLVSTAKAARAVLAVVSAVAALTLVAGGAAIQLRRGQDPGARFVAATPSPPPVVRLLDPGAGRLVTVSGTTVGGERLGDVTPTTATLSPDARTAIISGRDEVLVIDSETGRVRHRVPIKRAADVTLSADGRTAFVLSRAGITAVDIGSGVVKRPLPAGRRAERLLVDPSGRQFHVAAGRSITRLDARTGRREAPVRMPGRITAMAITPDGRSLYVLCVRSDGPDVVVAVETDTGRVRAEIPVPGLGDLRQLSAAPGGRRVFLYGSTGTPMLGWIDTATDTAGPPIRVGSAPADIRYLPDGVTALVLTQFSVVSVDTVTGVAGRSLDLPASR